MFKRQNPWSAIRWLPVSNASGELIPAYAVMQVSGCSAAGLPSVVKPTADDTDPAMLLLNGPTTIAAGAEGQGHQDSPALALYESGDGTPAVGEQWGTGAASWKLRKGKHGFHIWGNPVAGVVLASRGYKAGFSAHCVGTTPTLDTTS